MESINRTRSGIEFAWIGEVHPRYCTIPLKCGEFLIEDIQKN